MADSSSSGSMALLIRIMAAARDPAETESLLAEIWAPSELRDAAQRVEVAALLLEGNTYEMIAQQTGASTATISRVRRSLEHGAGMVERALRRVGRGDAGSYHRHWVSGSDMFD